MIEVTKREQRICFRTSISSAQQVQELCALTRLPRSTICFLLVEYALAQVGGADDRAAWWAAMGQLPMPVLHAAISQQREAVL